ncbi:MAG: zinc ABC transporter substrate-binding protein [Muribaculaceae bacterium]|nr:zinc ABC transporter substrate-binding protein [Muribaculaceae bacterium]
MKIRTLIIITTCIIFAIALLFGCNNSQSNTKSIAVSIQPQKFFLEKIVGNKYSVSCLLSPNSNPEAYEPNMAHLMNLEKSDAYFKIGNIGFELAISNKIKSNYPNLKIYDNSKGVKVMVGSHCGNNEDGHNHEIDPHIWSSVVNAKIISKNMYDAVVELDPKNKSFYAKNFDNLINELDALNDSITKVLEPIKNKAFIVWHPSLSYFARDYGLKQISMEYEGKESSIKHMKTKIDEARNDSATIFFLQREFDGRQAETLSNELKTKIIYINPMNYNWTQEMLNIANAIGSK